MWNGDTRPGGSPYEIARPNMLRERGIPARGGASAGTLSGSCLENLRLVVPGQGVRPFRFRSANFPHRFSTRQFEVPNGASLCGPSCRISRHGRGKEPHNGLSHPPFPLFWRPGRQPIDWPPPACRKQSGFPKEVSTYREAVLVSQNLRIAGSIHRSRARSRGDWRLAWLMSAS
jgi:hypothetical protein